MQEADCAYAYEIERLSFPATTWTLEDFQNALLSDSQLYIVAQAEGQIVGFAALYTMIDSADLVNIAVHPAFRGQRISVCLMERLLQMADSHGINTITLEVRVHNAVAIHLYEKYGFQKIACRRDYYRQPTEDACIMQRKHSFL